MGNSESLLMNIVYGYSMIAVSLAVGVVCLFRFFRTKSMRYFWPGFAFSLVFPVLVFIKLYSQCSLVIDKLDSTDRFNPESAAAACAVIK